VGTDANYWPLQQARTRLAVVSIEHFCAGEDSTDVPLDRTNVAAADFTCSLRLTLEASSVRAAVTAVCCVGATSAAWHLILARIGFPGTPIDS
jgi:hypothetical protein